MCRGPSNPWPSSATAELRPPCWPEVTGESAGHASPGHRAVPPLSVPGEPWGTVGMLRGGG